MTQRPKNNAYIAFAAFEPLEYQVRALAEKPKNLRTHPGATILALVYMEGIEWYAEQVRGGEHSIDGAMAVSTSMSRNDNGIIYGAYGRHRYSVCQETGLVRFIGDKSDVLGRAKATAVGFTVI